MISYIHGKVLSLNEKSVTIDVGGLGYQVFATPEAINKFRVGDEASLFTYLAVREDSLDLYGFANEEEKIIFEMLLTVSGIGPKSAIGILGITSVDTLKKAIATGDTSYLTKVSGIGRKTAEKIVLELRDKLRSHADNKEATGELRAESDSIEALKALGYSHNEAREALRNVPPEIVGTNLRIKEALKILGGK